MNETTIRALQRQVHETARAKGWWDGWPTERLCGGCGFYVDDTTCGCGSPIEGHGSPMTEGHGPIPMGCDCYRHYPRDEDRPARPTQDERDFAGRVIVLLALITTEVAEAIEEARGGRFRERSEDGKPEGLPAELADVVIRCFDLAGGLGIDLAGAIERKAAYNATRPTRHGGKLA
jgi:NTP pyrophosphatase (non-canonical NTP hydrolase)